MNIYSIINQSIMRKETPSLVVNLIYSFFCVIKCNFLVTTAPTCVGYNIVTGPLNGPVLFCSRASVVVVCRRL